MTFTVTATAAAWRVWPRMDCVDLEQARKKMDEWTEEFKKGNFAYPPPSAEGWLPSQLCLTVVDDTSRMVDYRNVKRE